MFASCYPYKPGLESHAHQSHRETCASPLMFRLACLLAPVGGACLGCGLGWGYNPSQREYNRHKPWLVHQKREESPRGPETGAAACVGGMVCLSDVRSLHHDPLAVFVNPTQQLGMLIFPFEPGSPRDGNPAPWLESPVPPRRTARSPHSRGDKQHGGIHTNRWGLPT